MTPTKNILILSFSIILCCLMLSYSLYNFRDKSSVVTVKGASEVNVIADKVLWNISFVSAGNNLEEINKKITDDTVKVREFLKEFKIDEKDISLGQLDFVDMEAREYKDPNQKNRFILTQNVFINSNNVDAVEQASKNLLKLIGQNVYLKDSLWTMKPIFLFTQLDNIKNDMLNESLKKAESAAEQFAKNSNVKVGKIKKANQGLFVITAKNKAAAQADSDEMYQKEKQVRVVSTIEYYLK